MLTYRSLERTTLQGKIAHEVNCIAVDNAESRRLLSQRTIEAMQPKRHTKFITEDPSTTGKGFIQPGTTNASNTFKNFIVSFRLLINGPVTDVE
jgi:transcription initiation factor TFIIF subunit beta